MEKKSRFYLTMGMVLLLQLAAAVCFCGKKTGFHYDEYYSFYSSNATWGLVPTDREWKEGSEIRSEFMVLPGEGFRYGDVVRRQTWDVHPPFYYLLLHTACSLSPGVFSKWPGLALNLAVFVLSWFILADMTFEMVRAIWNKEAGKMAAALVCLLYGFNPAVISGVMLVRMYMLLGLLVLLVTRLHVRALCRNGRGRKFYLPVMVNVYLGFLTHYYFAVYMFFLAAATEFYLLFETASQRSRKQKRKDCALYGLAVVGAMAAAAASYPACLGHIFRGYRGTEAMGEFFNAENTAGRFRFFTGLLNEYAFGSMLPGVLLIIVLLVITARALAKKRHTAEKRSRGGRYHAVWIPAFAAAGYFAVVAKTALLTAEEANRYQLPVYGLILMLTVVMTALLARENLVLYERVKKRSEAGRDVPMPESLRAGTEEKAGQDKRENAAAAWIVTGAVAALIFMGEIGGLAQNRVLFLYEEDAENIAFAQENHDVSVVYFYNGNLMWMIWDDSLELMQYDRIYFVNMADVSLLTDKELKEADRMLVYVARGDNSAAALEAACAVFSDGVEAVRKRELLYCDLYEVQRAVE